MNGASLSTHWHPAPDRLRHECGAWLSFVHVATVLPHKPFSLPNGLSVFRVHAILSHLCPCTHVFLLPAGSLSSHLESPSSKVFQTQCHHFLNTAFPAPSLRLAIRFLLISHGSHTSLPVNTKRALVICCYRTNSTKTYWLEATTYYFISQFSGPKLWSGPSRDGASLFRDSGSLGEFGRSIFLAVSTELSPCLA